MPNRTLIFFAGLYGLIGVGLFAISAHGGSSNTATAASFLLVHGPVLLTIGLTSFNSIIRWAAVVMLVGVTLFAGDLLSRDFLHDRLFAMAAPTGGSLMMIGWLGVAVSAFFPRRLLG